MGLRKMQEDHLSQGMHLWRALNLKYVTTSGFFFFIFPCTGSVKKSGTDLVFSNTPRDPHKSKQAKSYTPGMYMTALHGCPPKRFILKTTGLLFTASDAVCSLN